MLAHVPPHRLHAALHLLHIFAPDLSQSPVLWIIRSGNPQSIVLIMFSHNIVLGLEMVHALYGISYHHKDDGYVGEPLPH